MAGNKLGKKGKFIYQSDDQSVTYALKRDLDLAISGTGDGTAAPISASSVAGPGGVPPTPAPRGFTPRYVVIIDRTDGAQKRLYCFSPNSSLYNASTPKDVTIDGVTFVTTGRVGERQTF